MKMAKKTNTPKKVKPEVAKPKVEKTPEADKVPEVESNSEPEFKNNGKDVKIRLGNKETGKWITVKKGETVTISRKIALANGLEEVE